MRRPPGAPLSAPGHSSPARAATDEDAVELLRLLGAAFPEQGWTAGRVHADLLYAADVPVVFVIEEGPGLIATASVRYQARFPESGYVHWVAVDPDARGRNLGRVVMGAVLNRFTEDGRNSAILETDDFRLPAISSYLGQGFIPAYADADHEDRWSSVFTNLSLSRRERQDR
jgi:GNAT superfamily N-acetyltransferase